MDASDLVTLELIKRVKYQYLRCLDQKRWRELGDILTPDCVAAYSGGKYSYVGRDAILDFLRQTMGREAVLSSHRCTQPEIDITGPETASAVWALNDVVIDLDYEITIRGAAFYTDDYVLQDGRWLIARTAYKRTYEELQSRKDVRRLRLTASWWGTDGRSDLEVAPRDRAPERAPTERAPGWDPTANL
ncbi:MAG: SnoaL-like domain [Actinomycetia bacterium]|nr:SnoaL-like domain [Actinomycetes bacterium]